MCYSTEKANSMYVWFIQVVPISIATIVHFLYGTFYCFCTVDLTRKYLHTKQVPNQKDVGTAYWLVLNQTQLLSFYRSLLHGDPRQGLYALPI